MNIDNMLRALNRTETDFLVIGGVNFMFRQPTYLTYDLDVWVRDSDENLSRINRALRELDAEWGATDATWGPVPNDIRWLKSQGMYTLVTRDGALDIFRDVRGLESRYDECAALALDMKTASGVTFSGLSDAHMLETQLVLDPGDQKMDRIVLLKKRLNLS